MRDPQELLKLCDDAIAASRADQTEVVASANDSGLTRYANNIIHQNVYESDCQVTLRCIVGKRIGITSTNRVDSESLKAAVERACRMAELSEENREFVSLPEPTGEAIPEVRSWTAATVNCGPESRAKVVGEVLASAKAEGLSAFGAFTTGATTVAVCNSLGVRAAGTFSEAHLRTLVQGSDSSGFVERFSVDVDELDGREVAATAIAKCRGSENPREVPPGEYTVLLEENAVADLLQYVAFFTFNSLTYQEGRSFLCGKLGEKVCGDNITLYDDGLDPRGIPMPFDFEGVPRQKVVLIEQGIARNVVWDSYTAHRNDPPRKSTGHALPQPATWGPVPVNLFMQTGDTPAERMVAETERGILVTRFHYTNMVHPMRTVMTGMTRDGTFLIEGGKVVGGVKNMRFTQSVMEALGRVAAIADRGMLVERAFVPTLKIEGFTFSSGTQF
jgi:PmbA protein